MRPDASQKLASVAPKKGPRKGPLAAIVVLLIALVAGGAFLATSNSDKNTTASSSSGLPKDAAKDGKGLAVYPGKAASNAPTVDLYEDFQCPVCKTMEDAAGKSIEKLAADGKIKLNYHVLSFLDTNLQNDASARAANAAFCAADQGKFLEYHNEVFANQPQEGVGYTDDTLKKFGKSAGLSGSAYDTFAKCVTDKTHSDYVTKTNDRMGPDGVTGTPTIKLDGQKLSDADMQTLMTGGDAASVLVKK